MSNLTTKQYFQQEGVQKKFQELLGKKAAGFGTSVLQVVNSSNLLQKADPQTIYTAAIIAATLDLPINNNLGFAWIVPYKNQAQFQIGWKGFVQLAQRTGQYRALNVIEVYENQFNSYNRLTENLQADFDLNPSGSVIGYVAYFELINGFKKTVFWHVDDVIKHAKRFSRTYGTKGGVWDSDFDAMAKKTLLKNMLSKWGPLSIDLQTAFVSDQAVINDAETLDVDYVDNDSETQIQANPKTPTLSDDDVREAVMDGIPLEKMKSDYQLTESQIKMFE